MLNGAFMTNCGLRRELLSAEMRMSSGIGTAKSKKSKQLNKDLDYKLCKNTSNCAR